MLLFDKTDSVAAHVAIDHASSVLSSISPYLNSILPDKESIAADIKQYTTFLSRESPRLIKDHRLLMNLHIRNTSHGTSDVLATFLEILRSRRAPLLFLPKRYIGLGPTGVNLNDEVWAIIGSQAFIALGKALNQNRYASIGPYSVHGSIQAGLCWVHYPRNMMSFSTSIERKD